MTRVYFGTNRNPKTTRNIRDFGKEFSRNGLVDLRFGYADVEDDAISEIHVAPEKLTVPEADLNRGDLSKQKLGSTKIFDMVKEDMTKGECDLMLYIHGFDYTFKEAVVRAAEIKKFYKGKPMVMFLFTWPGDGSKFPFLAYANDRDDAKASGAALGRGMQKLASFLKDLPPDEHCGQNLHLMAHSMGNYALRHAIQAIEDSSGGRVRRLFDQVILMAADEDDDAFEFQHKLKPLPKMCRRVTAYVNPGDLALVVSDKTKGNPDRLGAGGPRNSWSLPDKVSVINCEKIISSRHDKTGHQYYRNNGKVMSDAIDVLNGVDQRTIGARDYDPETRTYHLI